MADPFDEFEFKPLTEGLGFHRKGPATKPTAETSTFAQPETKNRALDLASPMTGSTEASRVPNQSISDLMATLPPSFDFQEENEFARSSSSVRATAPAATTSTPSMTSRPEIFQPLAPRREEPSPTMPSTGPTLGHVLPQPGSRANSSVFSSIPAVPAVPVPTTTARAKIKATVAEPALEKATSTAIAESNLAPVAFNFGAAIVDAMVVAGMGTLFLVSILLITHINLVGMLSNATTDSITQLNLVLLFAAVVQMYMLIARTFFGATFGEWAFDLQLGDRLEQQTFLYPLKVLWRSIFVTITGFVVFPIASLIAGRDVTKYISGLQLYRRA